MLVFVFFDGLNSCFEDDNLMIADSIENNNSDNLYSKNYKNNIYEVNAKGEISKVMSNGKSYRILLSEDNSQISSIIHDNFMQIRNINTGEYMDIKNIIRNDKLITFDVQTSTGISLNGFTLVNNYNADDKICPWWLIVVVIDTLIELTDASSLEQCTAAMNELNCASGSSPYMEFSDGWFGTRCSVGCVN